ncbi:DUF397 domain-containing protein [Streptomyces lydicus]|uniref:DUF397 domain-containing protein n=1 Tax=Streptomyces lydicus TaxID=47763 RepID=UPI0010124DA5|nr:DUF397 domain-containing protein [Streptomyces lydicus]
METELRWRKSSYSGQNGGDCVECASPNHTAVHVRDSKNPHGPHLTFTSSAWTEFLNSVQADASPWSTTA